MRAKDSVMAMIITVLCVVVGVAGWYSGSEFEARQARKAAQSADSRHARIMAHVVERNPNATIKDFSGFAPALMRISAAYGMDYRLVMALIDKESQFNPKAVGAAGEIGLMQMLPSTAILVAQGLKRMDFIPPTKKDGKYVTLGSLGEPEYAMLLGVAFLDERIKKFGDVPTGLQAFNRGDARAREHWPHDDYASSIAFKFVALVPRFPQ